MFLKEVHHLPQGSIITFDQGYIDYAQYEKYTRCSIWYLTRLMDNAIYEACQEYEIPDDADSAILKDEAIVLYYGEKKDQELKARRITYWGSENCRLFEFITNNYKLAAERIAQTYKRWWQLELLE